MQTEGAIINQIDKLNARRIAIPQMREHRGNIVNAHDELDAAVEVLTHDMDEADVVEHYGQADGNVLTAALTAASWRVDENPDREELLAWFEKL